MRGAELLKGGAHAVVVELKVLCVFEKNCPASVRTKFRLLRVNSSTPSSLSSAMIFFEKEDCEILLSAAATVKLPTSTAEIKYRICVVSIDNASRIR